MLTKSNKKEHSPYIHIFFGVGLAVICFMLLFAGIGVASATDYYVATDGSDSNPGTLAESWRTIGKANQELQPGDTVYIKDGIYNEAIEPFNSGSEGQMITYNAYPNETVYINGESGVYPAISIGWKVHGNWEPKSYIVVDGFHVNLINPTQNAPFIWINGGSSDHNEVRNCRIEAPMEDNGFRGILVSYGDHNVIENNYIRGCAYGIHVEKDAQYSAIRGNTVVESYWSNMVVGGNTEGVIQAMLIENNKFYETFGEDGIQFESSSGIGDYCNQGIIIRNNIFYNNGENAIDLKGTAHVLIEENIIHEGIGSDDGGVNGWNRGSWPGGIMRGSLSKSKDVIIRKNILYDNEGAISAYTGYKVYNNDIVSNNRDYTGPNSFYYSDYAPLFRGIYPSGSRISIKNNIIGGHNSGETVVKVGSSDLDINNNCYFNDDMGGAKLVKFVAHYNWETLSFAAWQSYLAGEGGIIGADSDSLETNPLFINVPDDPIGPHDNFDFHLQSNSPAIDAGTFLTKTTNSGSGTQISVEGTGYFCDGFGITDGDLIQVGSNSPVRITKVDYNNNKITVERSISWNNNDRVSLPYSGSAPDIGAYEYAGGDKTCSEKGGTCCSAGQECQGGSFVSSSDCGNLCCVGGTCQTPVSKEYTILKVSSPITVDGNISEFNKANEIILTEPTRGTTGTYKLMWDNNALYIGAEVLDNQLNADVNTRDGNLWNDDSIEMMFDTLHNAGSSFQSDDYKFFVNVLNTQHDYKGGTGTSWNMSYTSVVVPTGTVNNNIDTDTGYTIEIVIPWSEWRITAPIENTTFGFDFVLNDQDETDTTIQAAWASSDGETINIPDGWGDLIFADYEAGLGDITLPETTITSSPNGTINYNDISFSWNGSDDVTPTSQLLYSYKLEGYDDSWSSWTSVITKFYNDLPNDDYTFKVKAKDEAGNEDPIPAERSFTVLIDSTYPRYDVNEDGKVDDLDISIVEQHFGETTNPPYPRYDVNEDGMVDILDTTIVGQHFGEITS